MGTLSAAKYGLTLDQAHSEAEIVESPSGARRLLIDPMKNVLLGSRVIRQYLGISSINTMIEWHEIYGLPVMKLPNGLWFTTISAIDTWIFHASELEVTNRPYSRGDTKRADIALKKAQRRVAKLKETEADLTNAEQSNS